MLALEEFALIRLQLVLQALPPFGHGSGVVLGDIAQVCAKACLCRLACCLRTTSRYTLRNVVSSAHQRDQDHALAIQP